MPETALGDAARVSAVDPDGILHGIEWIVSDPAILGGKPCIRGTRISVEFVLELLASGAGRDEILASYPHVPAEGLAAAFQYAADALKGEHMWALRVSA